MTDFGCQFGPYPDRPHLFTVFAADIAGESTTIVRMVCSQCGQVREVEPTPQPTPADTYIAAISRKRKKAKRR